MTASTTTMSGRRQRANARMPIVMTSLLALLLSTHEIHAFQPSPLLTSLVPTGHHTTRNTNTHLHAVKPVKKPKSKGATGFGANSGGFGSSKKSKISDPADPSKVRSVSGYSGSGTKVLASAANNFDRIRKLFGKDGCVDVYVRSPLNDESTFWYVGKVSRMIEKKGGDGNNELAGTVYPTEEESIVSQKRLILEYSKNKLRPQNMGGPYSKNLELWSAPGDSEMDVVQNKVSLVHITGSSQGLREGFNVNDVGYNPEIYIGDEKEKGGLRVVRDGEGKPIKAVFEIS